MNTIFVTVFFTLLAFLGTSQDVDIIELESTIETSVSQGSIGSGLTYLSTNGWELQGGGRNTYEGDSLFCASTLYSTNYAWAQEFKLYIEVPDTFSIRPFVQQFELKFQFTDDVGYSSLMAEIKESGYERVSAEIDRHITVTNYAKLQYLIRLVKIESDKGNLYILNIYNKV